MNNMIACGTRIALAFLLATVLLSSPWTPAACAGETAVVDFSSRYSPTPFVHEWDAGTFSYGGDGERTWVRYLTDGKGSPAFAANRRRFIPSHDFTDKFLKVWIKVDDMSRLGGMEFRLSSDRFASNAFLFDIPIFDDEEFGVLQDETWATYTLSFSTAQLMGKPDRSRINAIGWFVRDNDTGPVTAYWAGMAAVDEPVGVGGVVSLTFDDGYPEHYEVAAKKMASFGLAGTAYIMPDEIDTPGYMTLSQLREMQDAHGWDIAAHHATPYTEFQPEELERVIRRTQVYLRRNGFERGAGHLAYPLGKQNPAWVRPLVDKYFETARVAGMGPETLPPADPHLLRVVNVTSSTTPDQVAEALHRARLHNEWLILMFHYLVESPGNELEYAIRDFDALLPIIQAEQARGLPVKTVSEVWQKRLAGDEASRHGKTE